jgi:PAS domain S-box-containing protein
MLANLKTWGPLVRWLNDFAPQGILVTDSDFIIRGWNRWLEQNSGRSAVELKGRVLFEVFPEIAERRLDEFYKAALEGQSNVLSHRFHHYLLKLRPSDGSPLAEMQQTVRIAPLLDGGTTVGTITAIEDVSERVIYENELREAQEEAEAANRAKDRFLAMLSHDLRTPLSSILGWTRLIKTQSAESSAQILDQALKSIERNAEIQLKMIEEILDVSRIASGKLQLELEEVDLVESISVGLDALKPMAESKRIRLGVVLPIERRTATCDPRRFQQIVWNLASNAMKFTPDGGSVRIGLTYLDHCFRVVVADTGIGISPENLPRLFEPLWQGGQAGGQGGLGLGLAIVRDLVELHRGHVRVESAGVGKGATFIVELPWSPAESCPAEPAFHPGSQVV